MDAYSSSSGAAGFSPPSRLGGLKPAAPPVTAVLAIHEDRVRKFGGASGIRDLARLESAVGTVTATFDGEYLHQALFEMAAAWLYHICRNHPFVGGNKRTALACALVFLRLNGIAIKSREDELTDLVIVVAERRVSKAAVAVFLEERAITRGRR